VPNEASKHNIK